MGLPSLVSEFPVLRKPIVPEDYELPALDWQRTAVKSITIRFAETSAWIKEQVNLARYSVIPVGNLGEDSALGAIDTLYARSLYLNNHLLWYSDSAIPDLGGHENRDYRSYFQEELENPVICNKGFYRGYTAEISINMLAISTILIQAQQSEFDDATKMATSLEDLTKGAMKSQVAQDKKDTFDVDLDEYVSCAEAFKKLKLLCDQWLVDVRNENQFADMMFANLYRWLTSPNQSKLYDPMLHNLIHKMMKKGFL